MARAKFVQDVTFESFKADVLEHGIEFAARYAESQGVTIRQVCDWMANIKVMTVAKRSEGIGGIKLELL